MKRHPKVKDGNRQLVKQRLLEDYGNICWHCLKRFPRHELTLHHVHKFEHTHSTRYDDSQILCQHCHFDVINKLRYNSDEYWDKMNEIAEQLDRYYSYPYRYKK